MAYYYFDFWDITKQDCYGLLSFLIFQLFAKLDSYHDALFKLYSDNGCSMQKLNFNMLKKCLADMLSLPGQGQIYIIVDALDECPNFPEMPSAYKYVLKCIKEIVNLKLSNVNLYVASRLKMDIWLVLKPLMTLKLSLYDEIGQKNDIIECINYIVYLDLRMRRWNKEDKQLVINMLSSKADCM